MNLEGFSTDLLVHFLHGLECQHTMESEVDQVFLHLHAERISNPHILRSLFFNRNEPFLGKKQVLHWLLLHCEDANSLSILTGGFRTNYEDLVFIAESPTTSTAEALRNFQKVNPLTFEASFSVKLSQERTISVEEASLLFHQLERILNLCASHDVPEDFVGLGVVFNAMSFHGSIPLTPRLKSLAIQCLTTHKLKNPILVWKLFSNCDELILDTIAIRMEEEDLDTVVLYALNMSLPVFDRFGCSLLITLIQRNCTSACLGLLQTIPNHHESLSEFFHLIMLGNVKNLNPEIMFLLTKKLCSRETVLVDFFRNWTLSTNPDAMHSFCQALVANSKIVSSVVWDAFIAQFVIELDRSEFEAEKHHRFFSETLPLISNALSDTQEEFLFEFIFSRLPRLGLSGASFMKSIATPYSGLENYFEIFREYVWVTMTKASVDTLFFLNLAYFCNSLDVEFKSPLCAKDWLFYCMQTNSFELKLFQNPEEFLAVEFPNKFTQLRCIMLLSLRIGFVDELEPVSEEVIAVVSRWIGVVISVIYPEYKSSRIQQCVLETNHTSDECAPICAISCLTLVKGAFVEALEVAFTLPPIDASKFEIKPTTNTLDDMWNFVFDGLSKRAAGLFCGNNDQILFRTVKRLIEDNNLIGFHFSDETSAETIAFLDRMLEPISGDYEFSYILSDSNEAPEQWFQKDCSRLNRWMGQSVEHAKACLSKPNLRKVFFSQLELIDDEHDLQVLWNLFVAVSSQTQDSFLPLNRLLILLAVHNAEDLFRIATNTNERVDFSRIFSTSMMEYALQDESILTHLFSVVKLLLPFPQVLSMIRELDIAKSSAFLPFLKTLYCKYTSKDECLAIFSLGLHSLVENPSENILEWLESLAFPSETAVTLKNDSTKELPNLAFAKLLAKVGHFKPLEASSFEPAFHSQLFSTGGQDANPRGGLLSYTGLDPSFFSRGIRPEEDDDDDDDDDDDEDVHRELCFGDMLSSSLLHHQIFDTAPFSSYAHALASNNSSSNNNHEENGVFLDSDEDMPSDSDVQSEFSDHFSVTSSTLATVHAEEEDADAVSFDVREMEPQFHPLPDELYDSTSPMIASLVPERQWCFKKSTSNRPGFLNSEDQLVCAVCARYCCSHPEKLFFQGLCLKFECACSTCKMRFQRDVHVESNALADVPDFLQPLLVLPETQSLLKEVKMRMQETQGQHVLSAYSLLTPPTPTREKPFFESCKNISSELRDILFHNAMSCNRLISTEKYFAVLERTQVKISDFTRLLAVTEMNNVYKVVDRMPEVVSVIDVPFLLVHGAFHPCNGKLFMVAGLKQARLIRLNEDGSYIGQESVSLASLDHDDGIRKIVWVPSSENTWYLISNRRVMRFSDVSLQVCFDLHDESAIDAVYLDSALIILCASGALMKLVVGNEKGQEELIVVDSFAHQEMSLPNTMWGMVEIDSKSLLIRSSVGNWVYLLEDTKSAPLVALEIPKLKRMDHTGPILLLDSWIVAPSLRTYWKYGPLSFASWLSEGENEEWEDNHEDLELSFRSRVVGLADWKQGERVVCLLETGDICVYWKKPREKASQDSLCTGAFVLANSVRVTKSVSILMDEGTRLASGAKGSQEEVKAALFSDKDDKRVVCANKEWSMIIAHVDEVAVIAALELTFLRTDFPQSICVNSGSSFGRVIPMSSCVWRLKKDHEIVVQIVLTAEEIRYFAHMRAIRLTLSRADPFFDQISLCSLECFALFQREIHLLFPQRLKEYRLLTPLQTEKQALLTWIQESDPTLMSLNNLSQWGRAALLFPHAVAKKAGFEQCFDKLKHLDCSLISEKDVFSLWVLYWVCAQRTQSLDLFVTLALHSLQNQVNSDAKRSCQVLLALFNGAVRSRASQCRRDIQDAFCCDICFASPLRFVRYHWNVDVDICVDCIGRVPLLSSGVGGNILKSSSSSLECFPIEQIPDVFCVHCEEVSTKSAPLCLDCQAVLLDQSLVFSPLQVFTKENVFDAMCAQIKTSSTGIRFYTVRYLVLACASLPFSMQRQESLQSLLKGQTVTVDWLQCVTFAEAYLPTLMLMELPRIIQFLLLKPSILSFFASLAFFQQVALVLTGELKEMVIVLLKKSWAFYYRELTPNDHKRIFYVLQVGLGCTEKFSFCQQLCHLACLSEELETRVLNSVSNGFTRTDVLFCLRTISSLREFSSSVWKSATLSKIGLASACLDCAQNLFHLRVDPTSALLLFLHIVSMDDHCVLPPYPRFDSFLLTCLESKVNASLRQAAMKVLESTQMKATMNAREDGSRTIESTLLARALQFQGGGDQVESLLLFAKLFPFNSLIPKKDVAQVLQVLLTFLQSQAVPYFKATKRRTAASIGALNISLETRIHTSSLYFTGPRICLACSSPNTVEHRFSRASLDSLKKKVVYQPTAVIYHLAELYDLKSFSVELALTNLSTTAANRGKASSALMVKDILVFVSTITEDSSASLDTLNWELVGSLRDFTSSPSSRTFSTSLELDVHYLPYGNAIRFQFEFHANSLMEHNRCPRCGRPVEGLQCHSCGDTLNQCRNCRMIHYGDHLHHFFCSHCGFCRFLKVNFFVESASSTKHAGNGVITSEKEFDVCRELWSKHESRVEMETMQELEKSRSLGPENAVQVLKKYSNAYMAALAVEDLKDTMSRYTLQPSARFNFYEHGRQGCLPCANAATLAALQCVFALFSRCGSENHDGMITGKMVGNIFELVEYMETSQDRKEKEVLNLFSYPPFLMEFLPLVKACAHSRRDEFVVGFLETLVHRSKDQFLVQNVLRLLESLIREGCHTEACISVLNRLIASAPETTGTAHISPLVKRMRQAKS